MVTKVVLRFPKHGNCQKQPSELHTGPAPFTSTKRRKRKQLHVVVSWCLFLTELFNIAVNDFDAKKSARYSRVLVVTEFLVTRDSVYLLTRDGMEFLKFMLLIEQIRASHLTSCK